MTRVLLTVLLVFALAACQAAPATTPAVVPTETYHPTETATVLPTTVLLEATKVPTPTVLPNFPGEQAGALCEKAKTSPTQSGTLEMPYLGMLKVEWEDQPAWNVSNSIPHLFASSERSLKTIICVSESRSQVGTYTDMSPGYQRTMSINMLSWPDGRVLASKVFTGDRPPETKTGLGAAYGSYPTGIREWILSQLDGIESPDFLFLQEAEAGSAIAISPDGKLMALAVSNTNSNNSSQIMQLDLQNLQNLSTWDVALAQVNDLTFSPDGRFIVSAGSDSSVVFWDAQNGIELGKTTLASAPHTIKYSPDGKFIAASSTSELYLIDTISMQISVSYPTISTTFSFSPDGKTIYTDAGSIETMTGDFVHQFYDYTTLIPTVSADGEVSFDMPDFISNFTLSPDGTYGVSYSFESSPDTGNTNLVYTLSVLDAQSTKRLSETQFTATNFNILGFSPDGKQLALNIESGIWLLDTRTWQTIQILTGHTGANLDLAFSPDNKKVISLSSDRTIRVWSLER